MIKPKAIKKKPIFLVWQSLAICIVIIILPWALYSQFHSRFKRIFIPTQERNSYHFNETDSAAIVSNGVKGFAVDIDAISDSRIVIQAKLSNGKEGYKRASKKVVTNDLPVLGPVPTGGI